MMTEERIRDLFEEHGVERVKIGGFDIDGVLRGKYISFEKFWSVVKGGMGFCDVIFGWDSADQLYDKSSVTGWEKGYPDTAARIDLDTFRMIPWEPKTASFLLDFIDEDGVALEVSPRQLLKMVVARAAAMGFSPTFSCEFEFFIYQATPHSLNDSGYRNPRPLTPGMFGYSWLRTSQSAELVHQILRQTEEFGIEIEGLHTETGPGVFEAAIRYSDAVRAADNAALFKSAVKEICLRHDLMACFMAKPANGLPGCSGHTHQSLFSLDGKKNAFFDKNDGLQMSETMRHYLAGQVAHFPDLCALFVPNVNSYKRIIDGNWAPGSASWGVENRTCALRVINGSSKATRIENRLPGADLNPHTAFAAMLAAGLDGIAKKMKLPPETKGNAYESAGGSLPRNLGEATTRLDQSETARALLGKTFVDHYVLTRDWEVRQAEKAVTDWELQRYFELA